MTTFIRRNRWTAVWSGLAVLGISTCVVPALADDMMARDPMMTMKDAMKDDASKAQMTSDLAKAMVMQHMATQMCEGGKCQKEIDANPDMKKMQDDARKMANAPEQMKMLTEQIRNDPAMLRQVLVMAMAQASTHDTMGGMKDDKMMKH